MVSRAAGSVRHRSSTWEKRAISAGERPERSGGSRGRLNDCTWLTRTLRPPHAPGDEQPTTNRAAPRGRGPAVSSPHPVFAAAGLTDGERRGDRDGFADDPAGGGRGGGGAAPPPPPPPPPRADLDGAGGRDLGEGRDVAARRVPPGAPGAGGIDE